MIVYYEADFNLQQPSCRPCQAHHLDLLLMWFYIWFVTKYFIKSFTNDLSLRAFYTKHFTHLLTPWSRPSWETNSFSTSQHFTHFWNPKVHYRVYKKPSTLPPLGQISQVHVSPSHFLKTHLNIILPSTPRSPRWSLFITYFHFWKMYQMLWS